MTKPDKKILKYTQYKSINDFLERTIGLFEKNKIINGLMFGVCLRLKKALLSYKQEPLLAVVEDGAVIHLAALMTPPYRL